MVRSCLEACIHRRYSLKTVSCENIKINVISWLCLKNKNKKLSWELSQKRRIFIYENIMVDSFLIYHIRF